MRNFLFLTILFMPALLIAQNRYWVASATANWSSNNWSASSGGAPDGGGAPTGLETARFNSNGLGNCIVDVAASFNNILIEVGYNGVIDLNGNSFNLNGTGTSRFQDGTISDTPGTSSLNLNNASNIEFLGTIFNARINGSASSIDFSGGVFNAIVDVDNNSSASANGLGGCTFNDDVKITNSGTGYIVLGNGNPDIFNGDLELVNTSSSRIRIGYNSIGTEINGDLTVSNTGGGIWFGEIGGTTIMASSKSIAIGVGGYTNGELRFREFTQLGTTSQSLSLTGTAILRFQTGTVFNGNVDFDSPRIYLDGATFNGTSDFEKTGASNDVSIGGNIFVGDVILRNSGSAYFMLGNVDADTFNNNLTMFNTGSDNMYIGNNSAGNTIGGNLVVNNNPTGNSIINLSNSNLSSLSIAGNVEIYNNGSSSSQNVYLGDNGDVTVGGDLLVENGVSGTANSRQFFLADGSSSSVLISGETTINNAGGNAVSQVYLGNSGGVTFNGDLIINNTSTAPSSIVYCNNGATSVNNYNENIILTASGAGNDGIYFGSSNGLGTLANGKTISIGGAGFNSERLRLDNFIQMGITAQNLSLSGTTILEIRDGSTFNGNVDFDAPSVYINSSTFNGTSDIEKTGTTNDASAGGNTFVGNSILRNSGSGYFLMGNGGTDVFNSNLTLFNTGTSNMYIGHNSAGNTVGGNLIVNNNNNANSVYLANGTGSSLAIAGNVEIYNNGASTSQSVFLGNNGDITVGGNLVVENGVTGTANTQQFFLANGSSSSAIISGTTTVLNGGTNVNSNVYLGNNGNVTLNGDLTISNTSSANSSNVFCNHAATSSAIYNGNIVLESTNANTDGIFFGGANGSAVLATNRTVSLGSGGFISGELHFRNFIQTGNTAQSIVLDSTGTGFFVNYDSDWGGDVNFSGPRINTRGTIYRGTSYLKKTGAFDDNSVGGNTFIGVSELRNAGSANFLMGNGSPDVFQSDLTMNNLGTDNMFLAHNSAGNSVAGNLIVNHATTGTGSSSTFLATVSTSSLSIAGNVSLNNTSTATNSYLYFGDAGDIELQGNLSLINSTTSSNTGDAYIADESSSVVNIAGNVTIANTGTSNNNRVYLYDNGSGSVDGTVSVVNNSTGDRAYFYAANRSVSNVVFNSSFDLINSGGNTTKQSYLGNQGNIVFNGDVSISNNASANNSHVYVNHSSTSTNTINENIVVESFDVNCDGVLFGSNNGSATLAANKTVTLGSNGFIAGELRFRNFTQVGATAQTLNLLSTGTGYFYNYDSDWGGNVNFSGPRMYTRGTIYRGTSYLEKTGDLDDNSIGGNTFIGVSELRNTGSANFLMGNGNPDVFQSDLTMNNLGTDNMFLAYNSAGNSVAGNLVANNATTGSTSSSLILSDLNASTLAVAGNVSLNNTSSATNSYIYFGDDGDISVQGNFDLINNPSSSNIGDVFVADGSSSTVNIVGNVSINNTGASNNNRLYFYNSGNGVVDGTTLLNSNCTGDRAYIYVANGSTSNVTFNSTLNLLNAGGNSVKQSYLGNQGSIIFNGDVDVSNSATANSSEVYFNHGANSNNLYNENIILESFGVNCDGIQFGRGAGQGTLASGKTISLGANGFTDGQLYFRNFTQLGSTPQTITTTNNSQFETYNSTWNGLITYTSPRVYLRESIFNGVTFLEKTGSGNDASYGANIYNDDVTFKNSGVDYFMPTNSNASDHNGSATYIKTGFGRVLPSYSATNTYAGDINIDANTSIDFADNTGRILMDGTTAQSINDLGSSPEPNFRRLRTNNLSNEITLNIPINIQTELDLVAGNIISDATNFITMSDNAVVANVSDNAYVDGPLLKVGNDLFTFPVGKVGVYRPIEITAPSSGSAEFKAEFFATDPHLSGYNDGAREATLDHISNCEYWILDRINTTNSVNVRLYYDSYGSFNCSGVDNQPELSVARWDGAIWRDQGNGGFGGTTADGWVQTAGVVTSFSPFTLASTTANNPLPIELVSFTAIENGNVVDLNWETASEIDNDFFTIERSKDGLVYSEIEKVVGAGNSNQNIKYSTVDENPLEGISYYRLKQTDFNGAFTFSDIEVVNFIKSNDIVIYPNPVKEVLSIDGLKIDDQLSVYSIDGKLVYSGFTSKLVVTEFSSGVYQLIVNHVNGTSDVFKFVK